MTVTDTWRNIPIKFRCIYNIRHIRWQDKEHRLRFFFSILYIRDLTCSFKGKICAIFRNKAHCADVRTTFRHRVLKIPLKSHSAVPGTLSINHSFILQIYSFSLACECLLVLDYFHFNFWLTFTDFKFPFYFGALLNRVSMVIVIPSHSIMLWTSIVM